ncbi:PIG-P-domain-containing protein [Kalaharituber pfeilii]|nr:PIG-P-domain-containing protein [Kalaharituber pfeilii]
MHPTNLFPPFYNRPPTPLPPSPSLTSLLLPRSSTLSSTTPTFASGTTPATSPQFGNTPDHSPSASDTESTNPHSDLHRYNLLRGVSPTPSLLAPTDSSLAASSHIAFHTPRAAPKVPTYEYYGFVLYLVSSVTFAMYIAWSYLPSPMLHAIGIHYYPSRWWALALPSWLVVAVGWIYVALAGYNTGYLTPRLGAVEGVVDGAAKIAGVPGGARGGAGERGREWRRMWNKGTDGVIDVPIGGVCEVLYGEGRELEDWEVDYWEQMERQMESKGEAGEGHGDGEGWGRVYQQQGHHHGYGHQRGEGGSTVVSGSGGRASIDGDDLQGLWVRGTDTQGKGKKKGRKRSAKGGMGRGSVR